MLGTIQHIRYLSRAMPTGEAIKLLRSARTKRPINLRVLSGVQLRGGTTDIECFEKVVIRKEYAIPFPIAVPNVIIDAGANVGMATVYFHSAFPSAKIIAIEPEARNFQILQKNAAHLEGVTTCFQALWPVKDIIRLGDPDQGEWGYAVSEVGEHVETITPQELLHMAGGHIDIFKIDIEGAERELFSGNTDWLDHVGVIVIELHDRLKPGCARALYSALSGRNFRQEISGENIFIKL